MSVKILVKQATALARRRASSGQEPIEGTFDVETVPAEGQRVDLGIPDVKLEAYEVVPAARRSGEPAPEHAATVTVIDV